MTWIWGVGAQPWGLGKLLGQMAGPVFSGPGPSPSQLLPADPTVPLGTCQAGQSISDEDGFPLVGSRRSRSMECPRTAPRVLQNLEEVSPTFAPPFPSTRGPRRVATVVC